jgi:hypothetical protein
MYYIMGQDQAEVRSRNGRGADSCIARSREAIARSRALMDRLIDAPDDGPPFNTPATH